MKKALALLLLALIAPRLAAQTFQGTATFSGRIVATDALSTAPIRVASSLPATCTVGQSVYLTTQPALEWLHVCTSTNTWTKQTVTSLAWGAITGKPTTFAPSSHSHLAADLPATVLYSTGTYSNPAWITALADTKLSGTIWVNSGLVGIGTVNPPTRKLDVQTTNEAHTLRWLVTTGTETGSYVEAYSNSARGALRLGYTSGSADLLFTTGGWRWTDQLNIMGNVGVGKSNPATRLDVDGTVTATAFAGPLTGNVTGNASTATTLQTPRNIFGVSFNGSADIGTRSGNTTEVATVSGSKTTNKQLAFDASGNIIASATDIGAGGGGGISLSDVPCLPGDLRWHCIIEEFPVGSISTNQVGTHGWAVSGTITVRNAEWPYAGILRMTTGTTSGNTAGTSLASSASYLDVLHDYTDNYVMEAKFVFRVASTADMTVRVGIFESGGAPIARGAALYAHNGGNWQISYTTALNTETQFDLGVASDTNWHTLRIRSDGVNARRFYFKLDNGTERTLCESGCDMNTSSAAMWPAAGVASQGTRPRVTIVTNTNSAKSVDVDYFSIKINLGGTESTR